MLKQAFIFIIFLPFFICLGNGYKPLLAAKPASKKPLKTEKRSAIKLGHGANIHISKNATLTTAGDIVLEGDIAGEGKLLIKGNRKISIDAHNNTIANLVVENPQNVELASPLKIGHEMLLPEGKLLLNNFDITLINPFATLTISDKASIVLNGSGIIIECSKVPLAQNQANYPRLSPNQLKYVKTDSSRKLLNTETYTYYVQSNSLVTGAVQLVDPPPRLS